MTKYISIAIVGISIGILLSILFIAFTTIPVTTLLSQLSKPQLIGQKQIIGFLPYWLLSKANRDYSPYLTTLTYFALRIDTDGTILKLTSPTQDEPGWYALSSGQVDPFLQNAKQHNIATSLAIDSGSIPTINTLLASPSASAKNLVTSITSLLTKEGFTDVNLDIEYTQPASDASRLAFTQFVKQVRNSLPNNTTLTLEISPIDAIQKRLIDITSIAPLVNHIVLMAYDYHAPDSLVTGPIAPLSGAGIVSEYDVTTAVEKALQNTTSQKLILGIPLYGYEWETLCTAPRCPNIPGSGVLASSNRVETFLSTCATCSARFDSSAQENYVSFFSDETKTNHIIFFPTQKSTSAKIDFATSSGLGGIALWALGYEGNSILDPVVRYKNN